MRQFIREIIRKKRRASIARRLLQIAVAIGGVIPVLAGTAGMIMGPSMVGDESVGTTSLDSHFRYLSGLLLGIGIGFWSTIPNIEKKTATFQLLSAIVVVGGLGRLTSLLTLGLPDPSMRFGLIMELIVVPLLAWAQRSQARR